jgi:hypothetical protein
MSPVVSQVSGIRLSWTITGYKMRRSNKRSENLPFWLYQSMKWLGIWLRPECCVFVSFLYRIDALKLDTFIKWRFWAFAFLHFTKYSNQTCVESRNSASHGCKSLYKLGMSWSSSCITLTQKSVTFEMLRHQASWSGQATLANVTRISYW